MSAIVLNSARRTMFGLLVAAVAAVGVSSNAAAEVLISSGATANMTCLSGVCAPTKQSAVLNIAQLQGMLVSGNVTVTTAGAEASHIVVSTGFRWASAHSLTLDAYQSITINRPVAVNGTGGLSIFTNDGGTGGEFSFGAKGHVAFLSTANNLSINGAAYTLVADTTTIARDIAANSTGNFALANSYDATGNSSYVTSPLDGTFEGLGNVISNLSVYGGLFAQVDASGVIENTRLAKFAITTGSTRVGGLVMVNLGRLYNDSVSGRISVIPPSSEEIGGLVGSNGIPAGRPDGGLIVDCSASVRLFINDRNSELGDNSFIGGLVGYNAGGIRKSFATGRVVSTGHDLNGGLVGYNIGGAISNSYATSRVTAGNTAAVGGLVGYNSKFFGSGKGSGGTITDSYSTGYLSSDSGYVGGLTGVDQEKQSGDISNAYWDTSTSGIASPSQGAGNINDDPGITGLSTPQLQSGLPAGFDSTIWGQNPSINGGLPYLIANPPA